MSETKQTKTQLRVVAVLERMVAMAKADKGDADAFADMLEEGLSDMHSMDGFGTEGQCDPRGDFRNGKWSMKKVEGVDK